jgi:hypothetical protein
MSNTNTEIEIIPNREKTTIALTDSGFTLSNIDDAYRFAGWTIKAGFAPKGIDSPEAVVVCWQYGKELGISYMSALQNIAVINGRPSIWGDLALGLILSSGLCEEYRKWYEVGGKKLVDSEGHARDARADETKEVSCTAFFLTKRRGFKEPTVRSFSISDAKEAGLLGKQGPWSQYTSRQLGWRARGFALRDVYPDVLKGLHIAEESEDMPPMKDVTPAPRAKVPKELKDAVPEEIPNGKPEAKSERQQVVPEKQPEAVRAKAPAEPEPKQETQLVDDSLEAQLQALMDKDSITVKELQGVCKFFEIQLPRQFDGPSSMNDRTLSSAIEGFATLRDKIMEHRAKVAAKNQPAQEAP